MAYWLVKQEPSAYPFSQLVEEGRTTWDGVRNYQARNNLQAMKKGDRVLYYHSVKEKRVVGIAEVVREAHPDPTADDPRWVAVELKAVRPLEAPVALEAIKEDPVLSEMALVRQSRLSVMPVTAEQYRRVLDLGQTR